MLTFKPAGHFESPIQLDCRISDWDEARTREGTHATPRLSSTQAGNPEPSSCEATAQTSTPECLTTAGIQNLIPMHKRTERLRSP